MNIDKDLLPLRIETDGEGNLDIRSDGGAYTGGTVATVWCPQCEHAGNFELAVAGLFAAAPAMYDECRLALGIYRTLLPGSTAKRENIKSLRECIARLEAILAVVDPEDVLLKGGDA